MTLVRSEYGVGAGYAVSDGVVVVWPDERQDVGAVSSGSVFCRHRVFPAGQVVPLRIEGDDGVAPLEVAELDYVVPSVGPNPNGRIGPTRDVTGAPPDAPVREVTNLNPSGPGSFVEALNTAGPARVVFRVPGVIDLGGHDAVVRGSYVTIDGSTMPGVTITNGQLLLRDVHDVVIQHVVIRGGLRVHDPTTYKMDCISLDHAWRVIIDHCSLSWGTDELIGISGPRFAGSSPAEWRENTSHDVTISNSLLAEDLETYALNPGGERSHGVLAHDNVRGVTMHNVLSVSNGRRSPILVKGGGEALLANVYSINSFKNGPVYALLSDEWAGYPPQVGQMSMLGCVHKEGNNTIEPSSFYWKTQGGNPEMFMDDVVMLSSGGVEKPDRLIQPNGESFVELPDPHRIHYEMPVRHSSELLSYLVNEVGAHPTNRDAVDQRIIQSVLDGSTQIISHENDVGGLP